MDAVALSLMANYNLWISPLKKNLILKNLGGNFEAIKMFNKPININLSYRDAKILYLEQRSNKDVTSKIILIF